VDERDEGAAHLAARAGGYFRRDRALLGRHRLEAEFWESGI
jgi:hypothetical protein